MNVQRLHLSLAVTIGLVAMVGMLTLLGALGDGPPAAQAQGDHTRYVAPEGNCNGAAPCYTTVQAAVEAAASGDVIKVAAGTYTDIHVRDGITQVVYISKTVTIRGGYTTADWDHSDPEANPTTLDAQGLGRVLVITGTITPTVEGLRITGGDAEGLGGVPGSTSDAGGGVYVETAAAIISDCQVFSNTAQAAESYTYGGGLYLRCSDSTLTGNTISANTADYGGGLYLYESDAALSGNTAISNTANYGGGGLWVSHGTPQLSGNTISANTASSGGGLYLYKSEAALSGNTVAANIANCGAGLCLDHSDSMLAGNTVSANTANYGTDNYCGGLYLHQSDAALSGNTVISNTANFGGGLCLVGKKPMLTNTVVADNQAHMSGSGLIIWAGQPQLLHTTFARNSNGDGRGVFVSSGSAALTNTILVSQSVGIYVYSGATARLDSTLWWANGVNWTGPGTVYHSNDYTGDPAFVAPDAGDYHIKSASAALDKGVNAGVNSDIDGDPRPIGAGFDLGADEYTGIDLSSSSKIADPDRVDASEMVTYTIALLNSGHLSATNTVLFDAIPTGTTYVSGSAQTTSGVLTDVGGIRWTGTLTPYQPVTVSFCVTVSEEMCIKNTAIVTDRYGTVTTLTAWVNASWRMYLPLILKEAQ